MKFNQMSVKTNKILSSVLDGNKNNIAIFEKYLVKLLDEDDMKQYLRIVYQTSYDIKKARETKQSIKPVLKNLKENNIGWNHSCYDSSKFKQQEQDEFLINPFHVEEGVNECKKCKSKRVISYQIQERSCDEPMTTYCTCIKCGIQWSYAG